MRREVADAFRRLEELGLNWGYSGNISVRAGQGVYVVSPSGVLKSKLRPEDVLVVREDGSVVDGRGKPSVEFKTHLAVYRARRDVNAVVHAHPVYSGVLAALRVGLKPVLEELVLYLGGPIEVAEYAPPGTEELARNVVKALGDRCAVLMANHGALACGSTLEEAIANLGYLERAAKVAVYSRILGTPFELPEETVELERRLYLERRFGKA